MDPMNPTPPSAPTRLSDVVPADGQTRIVALTGAGISASAGLGTFRGPGGLWTGNPDLEEALHARYLPGNVPLLWQVWGGLRARAQAAGPTPGHRALAVCGTTIITQNVDGLHQDAGSAPVIEVHGSAARSRCLDRRCGWHGQSAYAVGAPDPPCPRCGGPQRPDLVLFGESLDPLVWAAAETAAQCCDVFLAVGTSAFVTPAKWLVPIARDAGALCVNVNIDDMPPPADPFHVHVIGTADSVLSQWVADG